MLHIREWNGGSLQSPFQNLFSLCYKKLIFLGMMKKVFSFLFSPMFLSKKQQNMSKKNYQVNESPSITCNLFEISVHVPKAI
jgi:hypothetical protein